MVLLFVSVGNIDLVRVTSWHRPRRLRTMSIIVIIVTITGPAVGRGGTMLLNKIITFGRRTTVCLGQSPHRRDRGTQTAAPVAIFSGLFPVHRKLLFRTPERTQNVHPKRDLNVYGPGLWGKCTYLNNSTGTSAGAPGNDSGNDRIGFLLRTTFDANAV